MPPTPVRMPFSQGYVSGVDSAELQKGELLAMQHAYYQIGDDRVWIKPGRSLFGRCDSETNIKSLAVAQFDSAGVDRILALAGSTVYSATPGLAGTFSPYITGLSPFATKLSVCHHNNRQYACDGIDDNITIMPDGTRRGVGIKAPLSAPTAVPGTGTLVTGRPTISSGGWIEVLGFSAMDSFDSTFALARITASNSTATKVQVWHGFPADATANRQLVVKYFKLFISGGSASASSLIIEKSEDGGVTWEFPPVYQSVIYGSSTRFDGSVTVPVIANNSLLWIRATLTGPGLAVTSDTEGGIYDIQTVGGGAGSNFSTAAGGGFYYATVEADLNEGIQGPPSPFSEKVVMATQNLVTVTRGIQINPNATHWLLYRTRDQEPAALENLGLVKTVPIAQTSVVDDFATGSTVQALPVLPLQTVISVDADGNVGAISIARDTPPPILRQVISTNGGLSGLLSGNPRAWAWSEQGYPESWPAANVNASFPMTEHDEIVGHVSLGDTIVFFCKGGIVCSDGIPRVVNQQPQLPRLRKIDGAPGCVGENAFCVFTVDSEAKCAWVSPFGVHTTNSQIAALLTQDIDFKAEYGSSLSTATLRWDSENMILWLGTDSNADGRNDRETPIHMTTGHRKQNGMPKWGQRSPRDTSDMVEALVAGKPYRYSASPIDGSVYVEGQGTLDASLAVQPDMVLETGQTYGDSGSLEVHALQLRHSDWGAGQTCIVTSTFGVDQERKAQVRNDTVKLDGERFTEQFTERAADWVQVRITKPGGGIGAMTGVELVSEVQGAVGVLGRT